MPAPIIGSKAIHEMKVLSPAEHGIADGELPAGLTVRAAKDPQGRPLIVVHNGSFRAFSILASQIKTPLPDWFKERIAEL